jgi:hypothetical protein
LGTISLCQYRRSSALINPVYSQPSVGTRKTKASAPAKVKTLDSLKKSLRRMLSL